MTRAIYTDPVRNYRVLTLLGTAVVACNLSAPAQDADPQRLFQQAEAAQQRGDNVTAAAGYQKLLRAHPDATPVRVNLGAALVELGRFREAIEQYRIVLAADPSNRMARMNLALAYRGDDDLASATRELERLHREDASDRQTLLLLADCLVQGSRYADALSLLAPLESGGSDADAYLLAGQTRLAMSQYDLAQRDAEQAQRLNPSLEGLSTLRGMILEQQGNYDAAEIALNKALEADANDFNAHLYLGSIAYFKRDTRQAELHLKRALALQPTSAQARYQVALLARANGQLDIALHDLEQVVRQSPEWLQPHVELAALYYRLHRTEDGAREKRMVDRMMAAQQKDLAQAPAQNP